MADAGRAGNVGPKRSAPSDTADRLTDDRYGSDGDGDGAGDGGCVSAGLAVEAATGQRTPGPDSALSGVRHSDRGTRRGQFIPCVELSYAFASQLCVSLVSLEFIGYMLRACLTQRSF